LPELDLLIGAVTEAGHLALTLFRQNVRNWRKDDNSPVSDADIAVDRMLHARLMGARPSYGWLSEETEDGPARLKAMHVWVVDPIDGTRSFLAGGDQWCISAALVTAGEPVAAVVYRPVTEDIFIAAAGKGATLNHLPIAVNTDVAICNALILGAKGIARRISGCTAMVSAPDTPLALRMCLVAQGRYDAYVATTPKFDWDICAGHLVLAEAGGKVTDLRGLPCIYNREETFQCGIVAAGRKLHRSLFEALT
jgi:myo-inositol-1(or 4)-monophosphatase